MFSITDTDTENNFAKSVYWYWYWIYIPPSTLSSPIDAIPAKRLEFMEELLRSKDIPASETATILMQELNGYAQDKSRVELTVDPRVGCSPRGCVVPST